MSGYCSECGNTQCICEEIKLSEEKSELFTKGYMEGQNEMAIQLIQFASKFLNNKELSEGE